MPVADYLCRCGNHIEHFFHRPPEGVLCEECGETAPRTFEPSIALRRPLPTLAQGFAPVVIHKDAQGNIRFPGHADAPVPAGFERVELRTVQEVRKLERDVNSRERTRRDEHIAREEQAFAAESRERRAELRSAMQRMSNLGKDFARVAMQRSDERRHRRLRQHDANFHVEAFSFDGSNRQEYRDERTGWRGRRE